ncbi:pyrimidine dimer DNA glycosylase/endonuclease V [Microbacterium terricola]|uniref:Pyrimidine dimer DNA glycosylase /DNA-(Apurinic or apyrimidinic site) lyase n=1 Tax=Microbacterium terricola TaxID=344163 RepID=A0ABM8E0M0_9MICO|nr:pyrimidine dimer DNA glycosylase/endonuclease V [Microbacterium terricola]UYK40871.1 pyrimidine dimer DNA glycosylase/endonuclease V [Microbacterium terricola]BDV31379.1 pyrimidine dimer DNA glycosylase /DNA-(apurinic or apyrimidinic site) lyase [Microbacterium terricola]
MRLWSLHPSLLDRAALVACWREGLLAQAVLSGKTRGYTRHPQLERFRAADEPLAAIDHFLTQQQIEATVRGYRFDRTRIQIPDAAAPAIPVTQGQLDYEFAHLRMKVSVRAPEWFRLLPPRPTAADTFTVVPGGIESWERP